MSGKTVGVIGLGLMGEVLSARLMAAAEPGQAVAGSATVQALGEIPDAGLRFGAPTTVSVKGKREPVEAFPLLPVPAPAAGPAAPPAR